MSCKLIFAQFICIYFAVFYLLNQELRELCCNWTLSEMKLAAGKHSIQSEMDCVCSQLVK